MSSRTTPECPSIPGERRGRGDITGIYGEIPVERTAVRAANLRNGVSMLLEGAVRLGKVEDD